MVYWGIDMKLFIIGNGFDIGHNLPTSYWDFRTFLVRVHQNFLNVFEEQYDIYANMHDEQKKAILWSRFETNLANIHEDEIISMGTGIEMGLESGDIGIEDTLYSYFGKQYKYIEKLAVFLKDWVRTIKIRDCLPRVSSINPSNHDYFITFNYTAVLENIYRISPGNVLHIHGSLREYTPDPIIGHGNQERILKIQKQIDEADSLFDEKLSSICHVVKDYYTRTLKDIKSHSYSLRTLLDKKIDEIIVIGHSVEGIDMPYFDLIDLYTGKAKKWIVYCYDMKEAPTKKQSLTDAGIDGNRIILKGTKEFYDLTDDKAAKEFRTKIKSGF